MAGDYHVFDFRRIYARYYLTGPLNAVRSRSDYYTAGGNITVPERLGDCRRLYVRRVISRHFRRCLPPAGDGLIYSLGFLVGWPIILFLLTEPSACVIWDAILLLTLPLIASETANPYSFGLWPSVVALFIAQMVGAGKPIELLFGLNYHIAVVLVGALMMMYVLQPGGMLATTWVANYQSRPVAVWRQFYGLYGDETRRF
ncbi:hypothetical protein KCP78_21780 [Salmonella enterica subsp. enterica]|nr:hypothetical protein KCP78_21780 [Salmonella enterica subsp. enterica]